MGTKSQTALITGASGGIGYELAKLFAVDHYNLVLVARSAGKITQFADELQRQFGISAKPVALDLTAAPAPQFLFVMQTTEFDERASMILSVSVWRVTFAQPRGSTVQQGVAAKSI